MLTERDSAWVDVVDDLRWIDGGKRFTWISERDGWRHLYVVSRDGAKTRLVTPGAFDLHNPASAYGAGYVVGVDSAAGWVYYTASPDNATQLYLYRTRLDGKGKQERVTPRDQPGYHTLPDLERRPVGVPLVLTARHAARWSTSSACRNTRRCGRWSRTSGSATPWPGSARERRSS